MIYLDSSFTTSLYGMDAHSSSAQRALTAFVDDAFALTPLTELETVNAFQLRVFRKESTTGQADHSLRAFEDDLQRGIFLREPLPDSAFERARRLSRQTSARLGTRTSDLLHVAAAIELGATGFFTFDLRQRNLAADARLDLNPLP